MTQVIKELQNDGYTVVRALYNVIRLSNGINTKMVLLFNEKIIVDTYNL